MEDNIDYYYETLRARRALKDSSLQLAADYCLPERGGFTETRTPGENKRKQVWDDTAPQSNRMFGAYLNSNLTSPAAPWYDLAAEEFTGNHSVSTFLNAYTKAGHSVFRNQSGGFVDATNQVYPEVGAFGNAVLRIKWKPGVGFYFKAIPFADCWFSMDDDGDCEVFMRRFKLTAMSASAEFPEGLPEPVRKSLETKPLDQHEFYHLVYRDWNVVPNLADPTVKPFVSVYYYPQTKTVVSKRGMAMMPYFPFRINVEPGSDYGVGNFEYARGNILTANIMYLVTQRGSQKLVDPPIFMPSDGYVVRGGFGPGERAYYDASEGRPQDMIYALQSGARPDLGLKMIEYAQQKIRDAWYINQLQIISEVNMSATEAQIRKNENMQLMGPIVSSLERTLSKIVDYVTMILLFEERVRYGLPTPPEELRGKDYKVKFLGQLAQAQRQQQTQALNMTMNDVGILFQSNPGLYQIFKDETAIRQAFDVHGLSPDWLKSPEEYAKALEQFAQQQAANAQLAQAQAAGGILKDVASVGKTNKRV